MGCARRRCGGQEHPGGELDTFAGGVVGDAVVVVVDEVHAADVYMRSEWIPASCRPAASPTPTSPESSW